MLLTICSTACQDTDADTTLTTELVYDDLGRETLRTLSLSDQPSRTLTQTWRADDRLSSRHLQAEGGRSLLFEEFSYDARGRLDLHVCSGDELPKDRYGNEITEQLFFFDALDNIRLCRTTFKNGLRDFAGFTYADDDTCQLKRVTHTHPSYMPQTVDFNYDRNGNMLNDEQGQRLRYDSQGRLLDVSNPISRAVTAYRYDGHNHLFGVTEPGQSETLRFYQNQRLSNTVQDGKHVQYLYNQDQPLGQQQPGDSHETLLLLTDGKHSVIGEGQQTNLRTEVYNAYGERSDDSSMQSLLAFNGEIRDKAAGWYLLGRGYRAYNPGLMRFLSPDSYSPFGAGGINPYMYCAGDPINFRDPTGHFFSISDNGGWDLVLWGSVDIALSFGNPFAIIGGLIAIVAGFGVMDNEATPSEKQASQQIGMGGGFLGMAQMLTGRGAKKAADVAGDTFNDNSINIAGDIFNDYRTINNAGDTINVHRRTSIHPNTSYFIGNNLTRRNSTSITQTSSSSMGTSARARSNSFSEFTATRTPPAPATPTTATRTTQATDTQTDPFMGTNSVYTDTDNLPAGTETWTAADFAKNKYKRPGTSNNPVFNGAGGSLAIRR